MLVPNLFLLVKFFVFLIIDLLKDIFEFSIIFFQDCVFCCEIERISSCQGILETTLSEFSYALVCIIHGNSNSSLAFVVVNLCFFFLSTFSFENNGKCARFINFDISGFILISKSMSTNDNRLFPSGNKSWDVFDDDRFSKDCTI